jgi:hypothetical protein
MRALRICLVVLAQGQDGFEGFVTIEANVIIDGPEDLPQERFRRIIRRCRIS